MLQLGRPRAVLALALGLLREALERAALARREEWVRVVDLAYPHREWARGAARSRSRSQRSSR